MTDYLQALPTGYQLQEYTITRTLGQGGFGMTYAARDNNLDSIVAIKEYLPSDKAVRVDGSSISAKSARDRVDFEWGLKRFLTEAKTLARFDHPNIVKIYRFFEQNGTGYMVMEFVQGQTLDHILKHRGAICEDELRAWMWPVMNGLQRVHAAGFLHRDIKPQNIMVRTDGHPVLLDFGAARVATPDQSTAMTAIMTPGFAPLEQYQTGGDQGPWTDIYALGAVLHCCITGKKPPDVMDRVSEDFVAENLQRYLGSYSAPLIRATCAALSMSSKTRPQDLAQWMTMLDGDTGAATVEMPVLKPARAPDPLAATRIQPVLLNPQPRHKPSVAQTRSGGYGKWYVAAALLALVAAIPMFSGPDSAVSDPLATTAIAQSPPTVPRTVDSVESPPPVSAQAEQDSPEVASAPETTRERAGYRPSLTVRSEPAGALVLIDREPAGETPLLVDDLTRDEAIEVSLVLAGYQTAQQTYSVTGQSEETLSVTLKQLTPKYAVEVHPVPADARVRILNIGPRYQPGMKLQAGEYQFEVAKEGFETQRFWKEVDDKALAFDVHLEQAKYPLTVSAIPGDAEVRILNSNIHYQPGILLSPGNYHVEVSKDGFETKNARIRITDRGEFPSILLSPAKTEPVADPVELSVAAQQCERPATPPALPGNADYEDLRRAKKSILQLQQALLVYRNCLDHSGLLPDQTHGNLVALNRAHNESVDLEQRVADEFNAALRTYKTGQPNAIAKQ